MRRFFRTSLMLYLAWSVLFSPLAPMASHVHAAASSEHERLPELGSPAAKPAGDAPAIQDQSFLWSAVPDDLTSKPAHSRSQGVEDAVAQGLGMLSGAASQASRSWFDSHHITSALQLEGTRGGIEGASLDVLLPFYNEGTRLWFVQSGLRRADTYSDDYRTTVNMGLGYRHSVGGWLVGGNGFYDRDLTGENARLGVGLEAWADFFKLSVNGYQPLSDWNPSPDQVDYLERPAKGWDVRAEGYLPAYSLLGATLAYERFYGDEVSLFAPGDRQKNPHAVSVGIVYNPIPLVGLSLDHRIGQHGQADTSASLAFNYRLGEPLAKQLSSANVAASRKLASARYDLVSRNNEIVLEHRLEAVQMMLPDVISDSELKTVEFAVHGAERVNAFSWTGSAAGFALPLNASGRGALELPAYVAGAANAYSLQAIGTDRAGRAVVSNAMTVVVQPLSAVMSATPASIAATGVHTSVIKIKVASASTQPRMAGVTVNWTTTAGTLSDDVSTTDADGEASVTLTSSTTTNTAIVEAHYGSSTQRASVTFTAGAASDVALTASTIRLTADGTSTTRLSAVVQDAHGNSVGAGQAVGWSTSAGTLNHDATLTDANGVATAVLTSSTVVETASVEATSGTGSDVAAVAFVAGEPAALTVTASSPSIVADGSSTSTLSATVTDANNNVVEAGTTVEWTTSAGVLADVRSVTNASGTATIVLTSPTAIGQATVEARSGTATSSAVVSLVAGPVAQIVLTRSAETISADGRSTSTISAELRDAQGRTAAAAGGTSVSWAAVGDRTGSTGTLSLMTSVANASGIATTVLTSGLYEGQSTVTASVGAMQGTTTVDFAVTISVRYSGSDPLTLSGRGDVTASVSGADGKPLTGVTVYWRDDCALGAQLMSPIIGVTDSRGITATSVTLVRIPSGALFYGWCKVEASVGGADGVGYGSMINIEPK